MAPAAPAVPVQAPSLQAAAPSGRAVSWEILGEIVLLAGVAGFMAYLFADSMGWTGGRKWSLGSALTPWLALAMTTPFLLIRIFHVVRMGLWARHAPNVSASQILDVGFRLGENPKEELRRFLRIVVAILVLYLGIWLLGFHVTVPLWVFGYMFWFGGCGFVLSAGMAVGFEVLVWGVYDYLLDSPWNEPVLLNLFG